MACAVPLTAPTPRGAYRQEAGQSHFPTETRRSGACAGAAGTVA